MHPYFERFFSSEMMRFKQELDGSAEGIDFEQEGNVALIYRKVSRFFI